MQGSRLLQRWMMRPLTSLLHISARHKSVEIFTNPENREIGKDCHRWLRPMNSIRHVLTQMKPGDLRNWACWATLVEVSIVDRPVNRPESSANLCSSS
jgi:DNA mismatch repair ATPase MutS